jgi:hypothetical protein
MYRSYQDISNWKTVQIVIIVNNLASFYFIFGDYLLFDRNT